jgi:16S rRNA pseudouridine516 synthase
MKHEMLNDVKAVIFDLDGTLVDSMWVWRDIDIEYLGKRGIPLPETLQNEIEGMSFLETAEYFKKRFSLEDSLEEIQAEWNQMAWDKYCNEVPLKDGAAQFLKACKEHGIRLGIATSNSRELVKAVAKSHGFEDYFGAIVTGTDVTKGKPAPDIYLAAAKILDVDPGDCLVFEDIVPGIMAGKHAGMRVCAVEDVYSMPMKAQKQEAADYYIDNYCGLFE